MEGGAAGNSAMCLGLELTRFFATMVEAGVRNRADGTLENAGGGAAVNAGGGGAAVNAGGGGAAVNAGGGGGGPGMEENKGGGGPGRLFPPEKGGGGANCAAGGGPGVFGGDHEGGGKKLSFCSLGVGGGSEVGGGGAPTVVDDRRSGSDGGGGGAPAVVDDLRSGSPRMGRRGHNAISVGLKYGPCKSAYEIFNTGVPATNPMANKLVCSYFFLGFKKDFVKTNVRSFSFSSSSNCSSLRCRADCC